MLNLYKLVFSIWIKENYFQVSLEHGIASDGPMLVYNKDKSYKSYILHTGIELKNNVRIFIFCVNNN